MGLLAARTDADRELHMHLRAASISIRKALASTQVRPEAGPQVRRRARRMATQLKAALGLVENIGTMQPFWDMEDPDLVPEEQKTVQKRPKPQPKPVVEGDD